MRLLFARLLSQRPRLRLPALLFVCLSVISMTTINTIVPPAHGQGSPTVFISPASMPVAPKKSLVTFNVSVSNMPTFAGWDIAMKVGDAAVLNPVSINLVETFDGTNTTLSSCISGAGLGCSGVDGGGVVHSAVTTLTGPYDSGNVTLFTVSFNSTIGVAYTLLELQ